jgi:hypothetical protein
MAYVAHRSALGGLAGTLCHLGRPIARRRFRSFVSSSIAPTNRW